MTHLSYSSAEKFILSREFFGMKLGLQNIREFLKSIGNPQNGYRSIHIAGTNGKGSTAVMLAAILQEQGYKTGLYTSPHLIDFRERIRVDGRKIRRSSLSSFVGRYKKELIRRKLSFFETVTALSLDYFERCKIDVAVIETGLGGRLDATNVLSPHLTMTTDIDFDHVEILGSTLQRIGREKAGIIKSGKPHLVGMLPAEALKVLEKRCRSLDAPLHKLSSRDFTVDKKKMDISFKDDGLQIASISPALFGTHQLENTALVLKAASIFRQNGLFISKRAISKGLRQIVWPGRFQIISKEGRPTIILDVAHNCGGIGAFVSSFKIRFPRKRAKIISGFVERKDHQGMLDLLSEIASQYVLVPLKTRRTVKTSQLMEQSDFRGISAIKSSSLSVAFNSLSKGADPDDIICVVGSHYLVGEFLRLFGEKWIGQQDRNRIGSRRSVRTTHPKK